MAEASAIETFGLAKTYGGRVRALVGLDLRVDPGEVFGYLGPNGAGKSTSIRLLLGLIHPTEGRATLLGLDVRRASVEARRRVGYLPGDLRLADRLTGREQTGYSIVSAESLDAAVELASCCPVLEIGGTVDVYEAIAM